MYRYRPPRNADLNRRLALQQQTTENIEKGIICTCTYADGRTVFLPADHQPECHFYVNTGDVSQYYR